MSDKSPANNDRPLNTCNDIFSTDENEENIVELQEDWGDEYNEMVTFLCGLHLNPYVEMFVRQGINLDIFLNLNEEDLCHIGMTNSKHRTSLLQGISQLKKKKVEKPNEDCPASLSETEVDTIMNNTLKHLTVIHASLAHTRLSLRKPAVHNSLVTFTMSAAELLERLSADANIQAQLVSNQAKAILDQKPGVSNKSYRNKWKHSVVIMTGVGTVCALFFCFKRLSQK